MWTLLLLDRAADRFNACMDAMVDSMMDRLEKGIDEPTVCTGENQQQQYKKWPLFIV